MVMSKEARELRNAYEREWRKKNPDKVRAIMNRHWEKKASELKAKQVAEENNTDCE